MMESTWRYNSTFCLEPPAELEKTIDLTVSTFVLDRKRALFASS